MIRADVKALYHIKAKATPIKTALISTRFDSKCKKGRL